MEDLSISEVEKVMEERRLAKALSSQDISMNSKYCLEISKYLEKLTYHPAVSLILALILK
jgi:hypothetical protein